MTFSEDATLQSIPPTFQTLKGNKSLLLQDEQVVWQIQSGSLALFATTIDKQDGLTSNRRYLFTAAAGEAVFGLGLLPTANAAQEQGVIAVALEETKLQSIALSDFVVQLIPETTQSPQATQPDQLDQWLLHWNEWLSQHQLDGVEIGDRTVQTLKQRYQSLLPQQALQAARGMVQWVTVQAGSVRWLGIELLDVDCPAVPLTSETWLAADAPAELLQVEPIQLPQSLSQFHQFLYRYLERWERQTQQLGFHRFQERERLDQQITDGAMNELAATLQPARSRFFQEGSPLLVAAGAVAHALNISIRPPMQSEQRLQDPLEAIALASGFRMRNVRLMGTWWNREHGALLAYTQAGDPVALLQERGNAYVLFDPVSSARTPVDAAIAQTISSDAYMFYRPLPAKVKNGLDIVRFALYGHLRDVFVIIGMGMLGTLLGMVVPQATAILINDAIPSGDRTLIWQLGLGLFAAACGRAAFGMTQGLMSMRVENAADGTLQPAVWDKLLQLPPTFFRRYNTGDLLLRMLTISQIRAELSGATQQTLLNSVFALLNLGLMLSYSVNLALVGIGLTIVIVAVTSISSFLLLRRMREEEELEGQLNSLNVELINGVAKLRVAAAEDRAFAAWSKLFSQRMRQISRIKQMSDSVSVLSEVLPTLGAVQIFWFAILFLSSEEPGKAGLSIGTFLAFNSAFGTFLGGVASLSDTLTNILDIIPRWERAKPIIEEAPEADISKADPGRLTGRVELEHVMFRYREDGAQILDDVSLSAAPGEFIAIVGPSGSGKSTLFRLLLGFESPLAGAVYYDGQDLAGLNIQVVRRQLGVVLQNGRIGAGSLVDNITAGALVPLEKAWEAARRAGLAEDIEQLPMGMHTMVSEGGTNLSGGQRQRLLIARALVFVPRLILLDEATSALDNRTQAIVTASLEQSNATRIVIAHRLSTIRKADRIYVLESGRVVQVGNFEELMQQEGLFARLVVRQLE